MNDLPFRFQLLVLYNPKAGLCTRCRNGYQTLPGSRFQAAYTAITIFKVYGPSEKPKRSVWHVISIFGKVGLNIDGRIEARTERKVLIPIHFVLSFLKCHSPAVIRGKPNYLNPNYRSEGFNTILNSCPQKVVAGSLLPITD